jgi:hypothetical protein
VFVPSFKTTRADQDVVPEAGDHVVPSKLISTFWIDRSSEAVPVTVTSVEVKALLAAGESITTVGGDVSGAGVGVARTSSDLGPSPTPFTALI